MADRGLVLSGARCRLMLEGVPVMYTSQVTWGEEIEQTPVEVLDLLEVAEHVATAYRVSFSCQVVRVITNPLKLRDGVAIFPQLRNILSSGELTATIEDKLTGTILANIDRVKASGYTITQGARGIAMNDVQFVAIKIKDESEIV